MTEERKSSRRLFWGISLALALAVHAAGLLLFQLGDGEANGADADLSFVTLPPIHGEEGEGDL